MRGTRAVLLAALSSWHAQPGASLWLAPLPARTAPPAVRVPRHAVACCRPSGRTPPLLPEDEEPDVDGPYSLTMIALFRLALGQAVGWQSPRPLWHYEGPHPPPPTAHAHMTRLTARLAHSPLFAGLVDISLRLWQNLPSQAESVERISAVFRAFPSQPQLLQDNKWSMEALAQLTSRLFPFLVGRCRVESWSREGSVEPWKSKVVIERCRFLEASSCKGMCTGLCKAPSESYFASIGLPISMTPNFEDGSCEMVWGRTPREDDMDGQDLGCYQTCSLIKAMPSPSKASAASLAHRPPRPLRQLAMVGSTAEARVSSEAYRMSGAVEMSTEAAPHEAPPGSSASELRVEIRSAGGKGDGAYAAEPAAAGRWIARYEGVPVTLLQTVQRYTDADPEYLFQITPDLYLDAMDSKHLSRFFNHHEHGNLNFTVDKEALRVDFFAARDIAIGDELCFDYGMSYWAGSGVTPSAETDSRDYTQYEEERAAGRLTSIRPKGPPPITPRNRRELDELTKLADKQEVRAGLLRCLEYFGAQRIDEHVVRIPLGLGADADSSEVDPRTVPLTTLEVAASVCVEQAAALAAEAGVPAVEVLDEDERALVRRWQSNCPPFASAEANTLAVAVLLLWSFPQRHGVTDAPMSTERWEELLTRLRAAPSEGEGDEGDGDVLSDVLSELEVHAPRERVEELVASVRPLCA